MVNVMLFGIFINIVLLIDKVLFKVFINSI